MLAPHSEGWPGEERLLQIGLESLRLWHTGFLDGLPDEVVTARESLVVAVDRADTADLRTVGEWLAAQGHPVTVTNAARDVEPLLAQGIRHGFRATDELAVDNRLLVEALQTHCEELGVRWAGPVEALEEARDGVHTVVIANGIDAPALWPGWPSARSRARCCGCAGGAAVCRCRGGWFAPGARAAGVPRAASRRCGGRGDAVRARPRHRTLGDRCPRTAR